MIFVIMMVNKLMEIEVMIVIQVDVMSHPEHLA